MIGLFMSYILLGAVYVTSPYAMLPPSIRVHQINFFDPDTGIGLLSVGGDDLMSSALYGSLCIQQKIAGASVFPVELNLGDKKIILETIRCGSHSITGVVIAESALPVFRASLRYSLIQFKTDHGKAYGADPHNTMVFEQFVPTVAANFGYALPPALIPAMVLPPKNVFQTIQSRLVTGLTVTGAIWALLMVVIYTWGHQQEEDTFLFYSGFNFTGNVLWLGLAAALIIAALGKKYIGLDQRIEWSLLLGGVVLWLAAYSIWAKIQLVDLVESPDVGVQDAVWLIGYLLLIVGIVASIRRLSVPLTRQSLQVVLFLVSVYFALSVTNVLIPMAVYPVSEDYTALQKWVYFAYPLLDMLLVSLAVILYFKTRQVTNSKMWLWFTIGVSLTALADTLFAYIDWNYGFFSNWTYVDIVETAGLIFLALAMTYLHVKLVPVDP
jgi:hypothetical protein